MDPWVYSLLLVGVMHIVMCAFYSAAGGAAQSDGSELRMVTDGEMFLFNAGDTVKLSCVFETDNFNLFDNPVMWVKTQRQETSKINYMSNIYEPFASTNRFFVAFSATPPRYQLELTIQDLQREDSGNYTCEVKGQHEGQPAVIGEVTHHIFVRAPVDILYFSNNNSTEPSSRRTLSFNEMEASTLRCVSVGGYPPPDMQVYLGAVDISATMHVGHKNGLVGDRGLRVMTYTTEMSTHAFHARPEHNGMTLRCVTRVTGMGDNYTTSRISVNFSPRITCEDGRTQLGRRNAHVGCEVRARPPVSVLFWVLDENGTTLTERELINEHWSLVTVTGEGSVMARLFMRRARADSFRSYMLVAENSVGISSQQVHLLQVLTTTVPPRLFSTPPPPTLAVAPREHRRGYIYLSSSSDVRQPSYKLLVMSLCSLYLLDLLSIRQDGSNL